jgi:hypothetical protein
MDEGEDFRDRLSKILQGRKVALRYCSSLRKLE